MRHFTLHITPRTTSPAVVCKTREFSVVARSRFSCDHRKVPAVQGEPKLVRGLRAPPRGLSGGPLWSLHPDAASQRIRSAGLSSRHLNQRSHKLCSASLGGLLDTASLDGPPALAETSAGAPAQAALRGKPSLPACDPLLVSSSTDWAKPGEGPGSVWGTACRGDAPVRGREGSRVAWPLRTAQPEHQHGPSDGTSQSPFPPLPRLPAPPPSSTRAGGREGLCEGQWAFSGEVPDSTPQEAARRVYESSGRWSCRHGPPG